MHGLKRILDRLGLKQQEFAELLEVSPRTVTSWVTGDIALPGPVKAYLRLLLDADPSVREVELGRLTNRKRGFHDGLYRLSYGQPEDPASDNEAIAMLRSGRILGTDAGGGKFEGTYRFDRVRQTNHVHVWLHVPPAGRLATGASPCGGVVEVVAELDRAEPIVSTTAQVGGLPLKLTLAYLGPLAC